MASRDLSATDLARMTGYVPVYVRGIISGAIVSDPARRKIEAALGTPIWSDLETIGNSTDLPHGKEPQQ